MPEKHNSVSVLAVQSVLSISIFLIVFASICPVQSRFVQYKNCYINWFWQDMTDWAEPVRFAFADLVFSS